MKFTRNPAALLLLDNKQTAQKCLDFRVFSVSGGLHSFSAGHIERCTTECSPDGELLKAQDCFLNLVPLLT